MKYSTIQTKDGWNAKIQEFDSIGDLRGHMASMPEKSTLWINVSKESLVKGSSWAGTYDYEEADYLLTHGWQEKAEKLAKKLPIKVVSSEVRKTTPSYGMVGHQASVPRYIMGVPQNMINSKPVTVQQKIITINKSISVNCRVTAEQIEEEGIKALQIIQALEGKGYRVKLNIFWLSLVTNEMAICKVCIKKPEERLSLIKVAFPIAHPSMLRRIMLNWMERFEELTDRSFTYGYGRANGTQYSSLLKKGEYLLPEFIPNVDEFVKKMGL